MSRPNVDDMDIFLLYGFQDEVMLIVDAVAPLGSETRFGQFHGALVVPHNRDRVLRYSCMVKFHLVQGQSLFQNFGHHDIFRL